jgi:hypothetical protein
VLLDLVRRRRVGPAMRPERDKLCRSEMRFDQVTWHKHMFPSLTELLPSMIISVQNNTYPTPLVWHLMSTTSFLSLLFKSSNDYIT